VVSACARDPQRAAATFVASGDMYAARHQSKEAQIQYRNALKQTPRDTDIELKLARSYEQAKDWSDAYRSYVHAAELDPRRTEAHAWLAKFLLQNGQFEDARDHAAAMLDVNPRDVQALILLASAHAALRDRSASLSWVQRALTIDPGSATAHTMLGALEWNGGDRNRAKAAFVKATELAPTSSDAWVARGEFHLAVGELSVAEGCFIRALAVAIDKAPVDRLLGMFYVGTGRPAKAEPHLKAAAETNAANRVLLAEYYAALQRNGEALALLQRVVDDRQTDQPTAARAHLRRAAVWHAMGEHIKAHAELTPLFDDETIGADAHALEAQLLLREDGDRTAALTHAREAVRQRPNDAALQFVAGTVYLARRELTEADTSLRRADDLAPHVPLIELELARVAAATGHYRDAAERARRLMAAAPTPDVVALLAQTTRLSGDVATARAVILDALKRRPDATQLYVELGDIELAAGRPAAAHDAFERAFAGGVDMPRARRGLVMADLAAGHTAAAQMRIAQWSKQTPAAADVLLLGAGVQLAAGDRAAALRDYERAAEATPRTAGVYTVIGMLKTERGDAAGAQDAYEHALQLDPNDGVAANNLAWIYADRGRRSEAVRLAETAHRALGDQAAAADTLGWMYYLQNAFEAAVRLLTKAADANPSNPVYRYHLGAALLMNQQRDRGRRELQHALSSSSTFAGVADAKRLLAQGVK